MILNPPSIHFVSQLFVQSVIHYPFMSSPLLNWMAWTHFLSPHLDRFFDSSITESFVRKIFDQDKIWSRGKKCLQSWEIENGRYERKRWLYFVSLVEGVRVCLPFSVSVQMKNEREKIKASIKLYTNAIKLDIYKFFVLAFFVFSKMTGMDTSRDDLPKRGTEMI